MQLYVFLMRYVRCAMRTCKCPANASMLPWKIPEAPWALCRSLLLETMRQHQDFRKTDPTYQRFYQVRRESCGPHAQSQGMQWWPVARADAGSITSQFHGECHSP